MPAKPVWYGELDAIIAQLEAQPRAFVDCATLERLLGVGRRRAQKLLAPCVNDHVGPNGLADRAAVIDRLRGIAGSEGAYFEQRRRLKLAESLRRWHKDMLEHPPLLVEVPASVLNQDFANLPEGVALSPGRIVVTFDSPQQGLEKMGALVMAISNDLLQYDRITRPKARVAGGSD